MAVDSDSDRVAADSDRPPTLKADSDGCRGGHAVQARLGGHIVPAGPGLSHGFPLDGTGPARSARSVSTIRVEVRAKVRVDAEAAAGARAGPEPAWRAGPSWPGPGADPARERARTRPVGARAD